MGKAEIEDTKKQLNTYRTAFENYKSELETILPKLKKTMDFSTYSNTIKPELDKLLFVLSDLEYDTKKIKENKIIKRYLSKEYTSMISAKANAVKMKKEIESFIPR